MDAAGAIEKLGFRRWYERQLIEAHVWLVVCLLGMIGLFGGIESLDAKAPALTSILTLAFMFGAGFLGWHALMHYVALMIEALRFSNGSTCAQCGTYGKFTVLRQVPVIEVVCKTCHHHWRID